MLRTWQVMCTWRMRRMRGEALTVALVAIIGTLVVAAALPPLNVFGKLFGGGGSSVKAPVEEAWKEQTRETIPVKVGVTPEGKDVIAFKSRDTFRSGASKSAAKLTYGERIGEFFASLTIWGLVAIAFAVFVLGITPGMIFAWLKRKWKIAAEKERAEKERVTHALTSTVAALREAPSEAWEKIVPILKDKHDEEDRIVIDEMKAKLHKKTQ